MSILWKLNPSRINPQIINHNDRMKILFQVVLSKVFPLYATLAIPKTTRRKRKLKIVVVIVSILAD